MKPWLIIIGAARAGILRRAARMRHYCPTVEPPKIPLSRALSCSRIRSLWRVMRADIMDRDHLLQIVQPMLVAFRHEITKMRSDGATQAEIAQMLDELDEAYSRDDDAEGRLVVAVLREAARQQS